MASARSLTSEQQQRVRDALARIVKEHGQIGAAKELGVRQQTVNAVINKTHQPGTMLAGRAAKVLGMSYEELVDGRPHQVCYRDLPGWAEAAAGAAGLQRRYAIEAAGNLPVVLRPEKVDARLVLDLAAFWLTHAPLRERAEAETREADEDKIKGATR